MRTVNNHLVMEHYGDIAKTMKYYFIGIDVFHDRLMTVYEFVEQVAKADLPIRTTDLFVMTEKARKKYVLDFSQIKQLLDGTLKFEGNLFFNENNILLCVKFKETEALHIQLQTKCTKNHPYCQQQAVHSQFFTSIGQLMKHVKAIPLQHVAEMFIIPVEAASVRLDKLYTDYFIGFLNSYRKNYTQTVQKVMHEV